jgi:hypothetical protein
MRWIKHHDRDSGEVRGLAIAACDPGGGAGLGSNMRICMGDGIVLRPDYPARRGWWGGELSTRRHRGNMCRHARL